MNLVERQERTQRIRYGLTGLAVVFLFVLLGTAISRSADEADGAPSQDVAVEATEPNEPLAEIGAAPNSAAATNESGAEEAAPPAKP